MRAKNGAGAPLMWGRWGGTKISKGTRGRGGGGLRDSGDTAVPWGSCVCCAWGVPMGILHWGAARISPECSIECHRAAVRLQRTSSGVFLEATVGWIILGQQQHSQGAATGFQWDSNGVSMGKPMGFPWGCEVPMGHKPPGQWQLRGQPHRDMSPPHLPQLICHNASTQFIYLVLYFLLSLPNAGLYFIGIFAALKVM